MIAIVCDHCGKVIDPDEEGNGYEIEVVKGMGLSEAGQFRNLHQNNLHFCGECSTEFLCHWIEAPLNTNFKGRSNP